MDKDRTREGKLFGVKEMIEAVPAAYRHAVMLMVIGLLVGTSWTSLNGRLSAAEEKSLAAQEAVTKVNPKVDELKENLSTITTNQKLLQQQTGNIELNLSQHNARFDKIENKLDVIIQNQVNQSRRER